MEEQNIWEQLAKLKGLELDEEFKFETADALFKFTSDGLYVSTCVAGIYSRSYIAVDNLVKSKVVKLPWKPKPGDVVYFPAPANESLYSYSYYTTRSCNIQTERKLVFKTKEEAIELAKKMLEVIK